MVMCLSGKWGLQYLLDRFHHVFCGETEKLEDIGGWRGLAVPVDFADRAFQPDILAPVVADARLNCNTRNAARQHALAIGSVLPIEYAGRGHRNDADGN